MEYQRRAKKLIPFSSGLLLASAWGIPSAYALNGYTYLYSCSSCATTSDFALAAKQEAGFLNEGGTYLVISASQPGSAYIQVTGHIVTHGGEPEWVPTTTTPVDENGNSLAGNTESQNEAYFAALDETVFGADRTVLAAGGLPAQINEPDTYQGSFINSNDAEVGPGIDAALAALGINWATSPYIKEGMVITVVFHDGTKAYFVKFNGKMSDHWVWSGKAWDKNGNRINRDGSPASNANTSGSGGGSASFTVGQAHFNFSGDGVCVWEQTVTSDGSSSYAFFVEPC